jgi:hypothetical protein
VVTDFSEGELVISVVMFATAASMLFLGWIFDTPKQGRHNAGTFKESGRNTDNHRQSHGRTDSHIREIEMRDGQNTDRDSGVEAVQYCPHRTDRTRCGVDEGR